MAFVKYEGTLQLLLLVGAVDQHVPLPTVVLEHHGNGLAFAAKHDVLKVLAGRFEFPPLWARLQHGSAAVCPIHHKQLGIRAKPQSLRTNDPTLFLGRWWVADKIERAP